MRNRVKGLFVVIFGIIFLFCFEIIYLESTKKDFSSTKQFVSIVGLPDLAISTEASYIRTRSLSDFFSIYKEDGTLYPYFPSTFVYSKGDKR